MCTIIHNVGGVRSQQYFKCWGIAYVMCFRATRHLKKHPLRLGDIVGNALSQSDDMIIGALSRYCIQLHNVWHLWYNENVSVTIQY